MGSTAGLIGNFLSLIILYRRCGSSSFNISFIHLLISLAVFDSFFLIFSCCLFTPWIQPTKLIPYILPLASISLTGSVYSVVAITVERFIVVKQFNTTLCRSKVLIPFIVLLAVSFNLVKFFELTYTKHKYTMEEDDIESEFFILKPTELRLHPLYVLVYVNLINLIIMTLIPFTILTVLNCLIFISVRKIARIQQQRSMTTLLLSIVIVFISCHSIKMIINIAEGVLMYLDQNDPVFPAWADTMVRVSHFLLAVNSSINIILYTANDVQFRRALLSLLRCRKSLEVKDANELQSITGEETTKTFDSIELAST